MDTIKPQPYEALLKTNERWLYFAKPHAIVQAHTISDVLPCLRELEDRVQTDGLFAAGFLSHEAAPAFDSAHGTLPPNPAFPLLWFGLYPAPRLITLPEPATPKPALTWLPTVDRETYNAAIATIKDHIAEGRTYQVNYTMRLQADFNTDPWNFFLHLARTQNNHAAYIDLGRYVIASASPELFFELDGETITGKPMKGTSRRGRTPLEDREQAQALHESEKNRAENVMIVDMIRNDLGRIARVGSVQVPHLFTTEKYPTLWQMTSTVTAQTDASVAKVFSALFPCASITGAPKVSTMHIISGLETTPRNIYTGSIGYIAPNRKATFNVAIRTALIDRETQTAEYGVGGGIVWDSTSPDEYAEALLKARVLTETPAEFSLLETLLWTPETGFFLRERHITRLLASADYFDFPVSRSAVEETLARLEGTHSSPQRIRLLADRQGGITIEYKPLQAMDKTLNVALAKQPVNSGDVFLFHKTTQRQVYENALQSVKTDTSTEQHIDDVLLFNERGELTEFTIGNLVIEMDERFYTPPISSGLLAGTFRAHLLESGVIHEKVLSVTELAQAQSIHLINSVRQWLPVRLVP